VIPMALLIAVPMLVEAALAARNERAQRARGGVEPPGDVYPFMRIVYPAGFAFAAGAAVFTAAKLLKWSAIRALGRSWTFRVIVVPGDGLVAAGPYRYLRHPNYIGVIGELVGVALMTRARFSGPLAVCAFAALLWKRIAVEERALRI